MDNGTSANLNQSVGYFNTQNGLFFRRTGGVNALVLRSNTSGTPSDARFVNQADWNGDKLDGTGTSGYTLDLTHPQILWMDFEWLGVGSVRCGFIINGQYVLCHTFNTANVFGTTVYMTTAILPIRYEITTTTAAVAATLTQRRWMKWPRNSTRPRRPSPLSTWTRQTRPSWRRSSRASARRAATSGSARRSRQRSRSTKTWKKTRRRPDAVHQRQAARLSEARAPRGVSALPA